MQTQTLTLANCRFDVLTDGDMFLGLGAMWIGDTQVRNGRLPIRPYTQTFSTGFELAALRLQEIRHGEEEVRIRLNAEFRPLPVKLMRDHSFDPIHETMDWDQPVVVGTGELDLVLRPATDNFDGVQFRGFSYYYEYRSADVPIFYLLDCASWELDGNITSATAVSQSSCSAPIAVFENETAWTTEGIIHWLDKASMANLCMTHNLPRWASHQAFDYQYKGDVTLLGVFERVDLIRTVLQREAGKAELKCFDKHLFDETLTYSTAAKAVMINTDPKTETMQKNLWTWVFDTVANRARAEFGLREEPVFPQLSINFWSKFVINDYRKDLLPAAQSLGITRLFIDNMNKSAMSERCPHPDFTWNMCCGHEYEIASRMGGPEMLKRFTEDCSSSGIRVIAWTNNDQALSSPINSAERDDRRWFVKMEDTRLKFGGAYTNVFSILNFKQDGPRQYWVDALKKIKETTGLDMYLFDSFYNLGFMPIDYTDGKPTTQWRELLQAFKELQDAGISFNIESFGPFGRVQHGCPASYNVENIFACYKIGLGNNYTTIPSGNEMKETKAKSAGVLYYVLAHMTDPGLPMFIEKQRIDTLVSDAHKQAIADYNTNQPFMYKRILQEDNQAVLWHDQAGSRATVFNFADRVVALPGTVTDLTTGATFSQAESYQLRACHTYAITAAELPTAVVTLDACPT